MTIVPSAFPASLRLYRALSSLMPPIARVLIARRLKRGKEDPDRVGERRGIATRPRPEGQIIWIHGASVGEVLAAAGLVDCLREMGFSVLVTSGTVTSASIVARRFPEDMIHQFVPYDMAPFVTRFLDHWRPTLALFVESDLWPNLLMQCAARRIPTILVNARMSERSFTRWQRARSAISALLGAFDLCLAQSEADAARLHGLGARRVVVSGNLKLDVMPPPADEDKLHRLSARLRGRPLVLGASTHPGEEDMLIDGHRRLRERFPGLLTIIVPRHPQRGEDIAEIAAREGLEVAVRSRGESPFPQTDIYVADTIGELGLFYRLAPIVYMGGSLVPHGGQNAIEAIKLGGCVAHGPHVWNFADVYAELDMSGGAVMVADAEELVALLAHWLAHHDARQICARRGHDAVEAMGGALMRTMSELEPYLLQLRLESRGHHA